MSVLNPVLRLRIELGAGGSVVGKRTESVVHIQGRQLTLSNLDKVLYPAAGFTKAQIISPKPARPARPRRTGTR